MAAKAPPPGVHRAASGTPSRSQPSNPVSGHTSRSPSAIAPAGAAPNISFLCHYSIVSATINDKVVSITKDSPNAPPKTMTHTSQHQLSSNILSLFSIPPGGGKASGATTLFANHGQGHLAPEGGSAAATRLPSTPVPTPPNFPSALPQMTSDIITAFNDGLKVKLNPKPAAPKDGELETPQDRTGFGIATDSFSPEQAGFMGIALRDTSKAVINAVFSLNRILDVSLVAGGDGLPATSLPPGIFNAAGQQADISGGYIAENTLGILQSVVEGARATKKPIKLQLLFAHHSEPLRNITAPGIPPAMSNIKSLTALILDLAPFPAGTQLMLTEEGAGTKAICNAAPSLVTAMNVHYSQQAVELGLARGVGGGSPAQKTRLFLLGQQTQLPNVEPPIDARVVSALAKSLAKVSEGSYSTFVSASARRRGKQDDPQNTSMGAVVRVDSSRSQRASTPTMEGAGNTFPNVCPAGPQSLMTPAAIDAFLAVTTEVFRKKNNKGPVPTVPNLAAESSTTTTANHVATATKNFLLFGATAPPSSSSSNAETGSTWVLVAFLQHMLLLVDSNAITPQNVRMVMNPPVATLVENRFRPLLHAASGAVIELVNSENERRAAEAARLAGLAAKKSMDASHETERQEVEEEEGDGRAEVEEELKNSFESLEKQSRDDKRRIANILLDQRRASDASTAKEHDRLKAVADRFSRVLLQLQQDELDHRREYARREAEQRAAVYRLYLNEGFLIDQYRDRRGLRLSEQPGRVALWEAEKRSRTDLYHCIRQMQLSYYAEKKRIAHEAAHRVAYKEQVQLMGELSTLNERYHQLQYVRARLEAEVLEKESKFLNRPHADALSQMVSTIVQNSIASPAKNARLFSSYGGGFGASRQHPSPHRYQPSGPAAGATSPPARQRQSSSYANVPTPLTVPSLAREENDGDLDLL